MNSVLLLIFGLVVGIIILGAALVVLGKMLSGQIDLRYLIAEQDGSASISRFQLLIFTFVIALSYFLFVIFRLTGPSGPAPLILPDVPQGVQILLGISGGSYVLSKGIQKTAEVAQKEHPGSPP
jgi:hypothetical protein